MTNKLDKLRDWQNIPDKRGKKCHLTPELILTSSAARVKETAEIVAQASKAGK